MDGRVWEAMHVAQRSERVRRIRPRAQPARLAATRLRRATARRRWSRRSTASPAPASCPHTSTRRSHYVVDLGRRPLARARLHRDDLSRHRPRRVAVRADARRRPGGLRPHPSGQGHRRGDRRSRVAPDAGWSSAASCRTSVTSTNEVEPHVGRRPDPLSRIGRSGATRRGAGNGRGIAASDRLRRAVRPLGRRGDGVRYARHRLPTRLDARGRR